MRRKAALAVVAVGVSLAMALAVPIAAVATVLAAPLAATVTVLAMPIAAAASHPGTHPTPRGTASSAQLTAAANKRAAQTDAAMLLSRIILPAGAIPSRTEPTGAGAALARPAVTQLTPNLIDDAAFWIVPGGADAALHFFWTHPPAGSKPELMESSADGFDWPAVDRVLSSRGLIVTAVDLPHGSTAVRVDAEDIWITPRPAAEWLGSGYTSLQLTVKRFSTTLQGPITITSHRQIGQVVTLINALPADQPGVYACPFDTGATIRLLFGGHRGHAQATIDPTGCGAADLTIDHHHFPGLTTIAFPGSGLPANFNFVARVQTALGLKLGGF